MDPFTLDSSIVKTAFDPTDRGERIYSKQPISSLLEIRPLETAQLTTLFNTERENPSKGPILDGIFITLPSARSISFNCGI
jgi:hypothetical protein